jgi:hypothetical protein
MTNGSFSDYGYSGFGAAGGGALTLGFSRGFWKLVNFGKGLALFIYSCSCSNFSITFDVSAMGITISARLTSAVTPLL